LSPKGLWNLSIEKKDEKKKLESKNSVDIKKFDGTLRPLTYPWAWSLKQISRCHSSGQWDLKEVS